MKRKISNMTSKLIYEKESYLIRGACFDLYKELGNGHKESVYQKGLSILLKEKDMDVFHIIIGEASKDPSAPPAPTMV